ncbi:MAG: hypothetical protein HY308_16145 [Gammaproteobacteria bacterium]|nr:hypothetical protein [Gammaproteobacteria bacterium]
MEDQADRILPTTLTKEQAISLYELQQTNGRRVVYLACLDVDAIFRMGKVDGETTIDIVRYHEDLRPMLNRDKFGEQKSKQLDVITYQENGLLYVLRRSGGVSLFDGMNPELALSKNRCWYLMPKETPIPSGLIIAKDVRPRNGYTHYALQPDEDMLRGELQERLALLRPYLRRI